jgi:hypothetical protein
MSEPLSPSPSPSLSTSVVEVELVVGVGVVEDFELDGAVDRARKVR